MINFFNKMGICISGLCIVHCLLMPFLLLAFPAFFSQLDHSEPNLHLIFGILVLTSAAVVIFPHCKKAGRKDIIAIVLTGVLFIITGFSIGHGISELAEQIFTIIGSLILIFGHYKNMKVKHSSCEDTKAPCPSHH